MKNQVKRRVIATEDKHGLWHIELIESTDEYERMVDIASIVPHPWRGWSEHFAKEIAAALNERWRQGGDV